MEEKINELSFNKTINIEISKESLSTQNERLCNKNPSFLIFSKIFQQFLFLQQIDLGSEV